MQLMRLPGGKNGCGSGAGTGSPPSEWKQAGSLCEGLRWAGWDAVLGTRARGGVAGGRARGVFVGASRRDHEGEPDRRCAREIFKCSGERDLVYIEIACSSAPPRSLRNLPYPWSISSRLMLAPPASMTARTRWLLSAAPRATVRLTRVPSAKAVER
jgi:hypothetical protein